MLRVTRHDLNPDTTLLALEGRLVGPWVALLRRECRSLSSITLDLASVGFVDAAGLALIRRLQARGAQLRSPSPFVAELLKPRTVS
jgi:ABC-type transporter Mla MlaB component